MSPFTAEATSAAEPAPDLFVMMAEQLTKARANNQFPTTTAPATDVQALAHDYELLLQLQDTVRREPEPSKGSCSAADRLRVEIARRIHERDEAYDELASRDEAVRRVEHYIRSVEHEREYYESISSPSASIGHQSCMGDSQVLEVSEDVISIYEMAAEQTMSEVAAPMMEGIEQHATLTAEQRALHRQQQELQDLLQEDQRALNDEHRGFNDEHRALNHAQSEIIDKLKDHFSAQDMALTDLEDDICLLKSTIDATSRNLVSSADMLRHATDAKEHLSSIVVNLPAALTQVISQIVQQQACAAMSEAMRAQSEMWMHLVAQDKLQQQSCQGQGSCPSCDNAVQVPVTGSRYSRGVRGWNTGGMSKLLKKLRIRA